MENENSLLDEHDIYYLCMSSIIGIGFFKLSHDIVKMVGQDGWIPNILGIVYPCYIAAISVYIMKKFPNDNIISIGKKYFGNVFGTILGLIYMMEFIMLIPSITSGFTNVLRVYAVTFLPRINIIICIVAVAWYCSLSGIKNIARMSKLIIIIFIIPIVISIGALKSGSILNLQPVFQSSVKNIVKSTFLTIFQYSGIEFLVLIHPYFKNKKSPQKPIFKAIFTLMIIYTWIVFISIYYLGPELVPKASWPFTLVTESIVVPVINNFRFVFVSLWSIVMIKTASNYYYYVCLGIKSNLGIENKVVAVGLFPITIIIAMLYKNEITRRYIGNLIINSTVIFNVVYLTVIFAITYMKEKQKLNTHKKVENKRT
ncbi:GerAB/ArcD/ProY family transporter [Clostridium novyi]|uniref:Spore germination protein n=1 Tax=Clostridium novyi (strain NT) TaxID=386415 RepID=A0Q242_CLONN|nr:endospore germination permease [Clostridium novyi]ABK61435.1 spore germination protein [Clostridium novyi NT]KEH85303.1 spore gernimation protein [Clostridium novyi A str. BKT29909]KEH86212.1 spore gernimation protein [Clostridium novyi A str. NCTC 538]KEH88497.1 spore gernimation protein [Clostridium novyi A str. 4540]